MRSRPIFGLLLLGLLLCAATARAQDLTATVENQVEDYPPAPGVRTFSMMVHRTFLVLPDGTRIRVKGDHHFKTGDKVRVKKEKVHGKARKDEATEATIAIADVSLVTAATVQATTVVPWAMLVICTPSHPCQGLSQGQTTMAQADAFWRAGSYGVFGVTPTVYEALVAEPDQTVCAPSAVTAAGLAVLRAKGITPAYAKLHTVLTPIAACHWGGLAQVGGSQSWGIGYWTLPHEGGHNLGMGHSGFYRRNGTAVSVDAYGDNYDPMGQCCDMAKQHYNAGQKVRYLHWLTSQVVTVSGTYTLAPYESQSGTRVLEFVQPPDGSNITRSFFVETRANYGGAVLIHKQEALWDVDPGPTDTRTLAPGASTVIDLGGTLTRLTTIRSDTTGAVIQVAVGVTPQPPPLPPSTLTVTVVSPVPGAAFPNAQTSTVGFQAVVQGSAGVVSITGTFGLGPTRMTCNAAQTVMNGSNKCVAAGGTWTFTFTTGAGPGPREMWFEGKNAAGVITKTPVQKVVIQ